MNDESRYGKGRGWRKGRGKGKGMSRNPGRGLGRGQRSASLRDLAPASLSLDASSRILALKTHARAIVNRLRGIDERISHDEEANSQTSAREKYPLGQVDGNRVPIRMIAVVDQEQCVRCGLCVDVCPEHAVSMNDDVEIDSDKCIACGSCVDECVHEAISLVERTEHAVS